MVPHAALTEELRGAGGDKADVAGDEPGSFQVVAENADEDSVASSEISIAEGDVFIVSPMLEKGSIHVVLKDVDTEEVALDETVSGSVFYSYEVKPGDYTLEVSGASGAAATGSVSILTTSAKAIEEQDESLKQTLEEMGVDADAPLDQTGAGK